MKFVAVHTLFPAGDPARWTADMTALRDEAAAGLTDAHAELGIGFAPTWPGLPLIQLDHVLYGSGLAAVSASEHTLPGTDHRAVVAELALVR